MTQMKKVCCVLITLVLIAIAIIVGLGFAFRNTKHGDEPQLDIDYGKAVELSLKFLDIQKAGKLVDNKIKWRGDSALKDGSEVDVDLSKGLYDAGDHMKFGFPMAFTASILAWTMVEYGESLQYVGQYKAAMDSLKWISDYLANAHAQENMLYVQVGDPEQDHKCWERPETMSENRPVSQINKTSPGSDVAAETSAALALAAIVFTEPFIDKFGL